MRLAALEIKLRKNIPISVFFASVGALSQARETSKVPEFRIVGKVFAVFGAARKFGPGHSQLISVQSSRSLLW
jgi:hypothetical protein